MPFVTVAPHTTQTDGGINLQYEDSSLRACFVLLKTQSRSSFFHLLPDTDEILWFRSLFQPIFSSGNQEAFL
jgi:hypothetical protein